MGETVRDRISVARLPGAGLTWQRSSAEKLEAAIAELEAAEKKIEALTRTVQNQEALIASREARADGFAAAIRRIAEAPHSDWPKAIDDARRLVG